MAIGDVNLTLALGGANPDAIIEGTLRFVDDVGDGTSATYRWDGQSQLPILWPAVVGTPLGETERGRWIITIFGGGGGGGDVTVVANVATLRALPTAGLTTGTTVDVLGYWNSGDGGGGTFRFVAGDATAANGGTILAPLAGTGRWFRLVDTDAMNVRWFGAVGDYDYNTLAGGTHDTAGIQAALTVARTEKFATVVVPAGIYKVESTLQLTSGLTIQGEGQGTVLWAPAAAGLAQVVTIGYPNDPPTVMPAYAFGAHLVNLSIGGFATAGIYCVAMSACSVQVWIAGQFDEAFRAFRPNGLHPSAGDGDPRGAVESSTIDLRRGSNASGAVPTLLQIKRLFSVKGWVNGCDVYVDFTYPKDYGIYVESTYAASPSTFRGIVQGAGLNLDGQGVGLGYGARFINCVAMQCPRLYLEGCTHGIVYEGTRASAIGETLGDVEVLASNRAAMVGGTAGLVLVNAEAIETRILSAESNELSTEAIARGNLGTVVLGMTRHTGRPYNEVGTQLSGRNLVANGDFKRWSSNVAQTPNCIWGFNDQPSISRYLGTRCGVGMADTTRTNGSPWCAKVEFWPSWGGQLNTLLCGPLPQAMLGTVITASGKFKNGGNLGISYPGNTYNDPDYYVGGVGPLALDCENGFKWVSFAWVINQAMVDQGIVLRIITPPDGGGSTYVSELYAGFGVGAPRSFEPCAGTYDGQVTLLNGVMVLAGSVPPATDPFFGEPPLPGDVTLNTGSGLTVGWRWNGTVWCPFNAQLP